MIVRPTPDGGVFLTRQTDHALASGEVARRWAWEIPQRASTIIAASRHDDGWSQWELAPKIRPDGQVMDFRSTPATEHSELYARGIQLVSQEDAFAGLVASLHGDRLYTRPFFEGDEPNIEKLNGDERAAADRFVEGERARQAILAEEAVRMKGGPLAAGDVAADSDEAWRLLQVWDRMTLFPAAGLVTPDFDHELPEVMGPDGPVKIRMRGLKDDSISLDPFPFKGAQSIPVLGFALDRSSFSTVADFRSAFRAAKPQVTELRFVAG